MRFSRRDFLAVSAAGLCTLAVSTGLSGCSDDSDDGIDVSFDHGVASGDPTGDQVIVWTRVSPRDAQPDSVSVTYEMALDAAFATVVRSGTTRAYALSDYTIKIDMKSLEADCVYYYRFRSNGTVSPTGRTKTLPLLSPEQVKMAVFSCANYPKGYFNAYDLAAAVADLDVALHLGDYIYEYGMLDAEGNPAYATENAEAIGRALPADNDTELLTLADYRRRYALYRTDAGLQTLHAQVPFIAVWDDHEVANDAYKDGAENHNDGEGDYETRKQAALQAYFEWLPIRPQGDAETIYRSFHFGSLVSLHMLDTRIIGRDKQLSYGDFITVDGLDAAAFTAAMGDTSRSMLGSSQLAWLQGAMAGSSATWQVLGQQVLMAKMFIPAEIMLLLGQIESVDDPATLEALLTQANTAFAELATIKARMLAGDPTLSAEEIARVETVLPYNLDAWDGYYAERETLLATAVALGKNLVVLAGDTHNAWASNLLTDAANPVGGGVSAGVEFATGSVTSPGMEEYLMLTTMEAAMQFEGALELLIDPLKYANLNNRGFLTVTFRADAATAEWTFVDTIDTTAYGVLGGRAHQQSVAAGSNTLS